MPHKITKNVQICAPLEALSEKSHAQQQNEKRAVASDVAGSSAHITSIKNWPLAERPREKLLQQGAHTLSDAELLAIVLRSGSTTMSVLDLARALLNKFGSLGALFHASQQDLCRFKGLGPAKSAQLKAIAELTQRQLKEQLSAKQYLNSSHNTREYLRLRYQHADKEVFCCLFLDSQYGVIAVEELFYGSIDHSHVYPRELIKKCLEHRAAAVIFAHNHPSGISEPSDVDIAITQRLIQALELLDIRVVDHLIIGATVTSFADSGLI